MSSQRHWGHIDLPDNAVMTPRAEINEGDIVISSHSGRRKVIKAQTLGTVGPGTVYLSLEGTIGPEAYPGDSLIPKIVENA